MARLRLFGRLADLAGVAEVDLPDEKSVDEVVAWTTRRFGPDFGELARTSRIWVNGRDPERGVVLEEADEVALLPPVSGG